MTFAARAIAICAAAAFGLPSAFAQERKVTHYDALKRAKVGIETCLKTEVLNGASCIRKCQEGFRLDLKSDPPLCIATSPNARYVPERPPEYQSPDKPLPRNMEKGPG